MFWYCLFWKKKPQNVNIQKGSSTNFPPKISALNFMSPDIIKDCLSWMLLFLDSRSLFPDLSVILVPGTCSISNTSSVYFLVNSLHTQVIFLACWPLTTSLLQCSHFPSCLSCVLPGHAIDIVITNLTLCISLFNQHILSFHLLLQGTQLQQNLTPTRSYNPLFY